MFCIASVLYQNCSTQALEYSNQNLVLYFAGNNIPCLKTSQIELNILDYSVAFLLSIMVVNQV